MTTSDSFHKGAYDISSLIKASIFEASLLVTFKHLCAIETFIEIGCDRNIYQEGHFNR